MPGLQQARLIFEDRPGPHTIQYAGNMVLRANCVDLCDLVVQCGGAGKAAIVGSAEPVANPFCTVRHGDGSMTWVTVNFFGHLKRPGVMKKP